MYEERMSLFPSVPFAMFFIVFPPFHQSFLLFLLSLVFNSSAQIYMKLQKKKKKYSSLSILKNVIILKALRPEMVNLYGLRTALQS